MARKPRKMMIGTHTLTQLPSGSWRCRVECAPDPDGKRKWRSFTDPDPQSLVEAVTAFLAAGGDKKKKPMAALTLGAAMDEYIKTCTIAGHSPATVRGYETIRRAIVPIEQLRTDRITTADLQRYINARAADHAPKTVINEYNLIHKVLTAQGRSHDFSGIILPTKRNQVNADAGVAIPTDAQIDQLLSYSMQHGKDYFLAVLLAAMAGLRRSEICALTWADVDTAENTITISRALVRGNDRAYHTKSTKSSAGSRVLTVAPELSAILEGYRQSPEDPVITVTPASISDFYARAREALHIPGRFHDLRHYHCSVMVALGTPREYIMRDMGHSTDTMYQRVYTHMFPDTKKEMYAALAAHTSSRLSAILPPQRDTKCDTEAQKTK